MRAAGSPCSFIVRLSALRSRHFYVQLFSRDYLGLAIVEHDADHQRAFLSRVLADSRPHLSRGREGTHARLPHRPEAGAKCRSGTGRVSPASRTEPARSRASTTNRRRGASRKAGSSQCNFRIRDPLPGEVEDIYLPRRFFRLRRLCVGRAWHAAPDKGLTYRVCVINFKSRSHRTHADHAQIAAKDATPSCALAVVGGRLAS
jgi:hypothetical protein